MRTPARETPWWLSFALRLRFTAPARAALLSLALATLVLSVGLHLAAASLLSTTQMDERDFGRFSQSLSVSLGACDPAKQCPLESKIPAIAAQAGATSSQALRTIAGVRIDRTKANAGLLEGYWDRTTYPEAYSLTEGSWPTRAGDILAPREWHVAPGTRLTTYGGAFTLNVVGSVAARYDDKEQTLLAAPGTGGVLYEALTANGRRYRLPESIVTLRTDGANPAALERAAGREAAVMTGADEAAVYAGIKDTTLHRAGDVDGWPQYLNRLPVISGWLPLALVPFVFALIAGFAGAHRLARGTRIAAAVGLPTRRVNIAAGAAWGCATLVAALLGVVAGRFLAQAFHPWLRSSLTRPLSSPPSTAWLLGAVLALAAAGLVPHLVLAGYRSCRAQYGPAFVRLARPVRAVLHAVSLVLIAWTAATVVGSFVTEALNNEREMMRWILASCLLLALAFALATTAIRDRASRLPVPVTLALRRIHATRTSSMLLIAVVMLAAALPLSAGITMSTAEYRSNLTRVSNVPRGQVVLGMNFADEGGLPPHIRASFEKYTGLSNPVMTRQAKVFTTGDIMQGLPYVMDSPNDVERFIGHPLTPAQITTFNAGGILVPDFAGNVIKEGQILGTTTPQGKPTGTLKATLVKDVPESYHIGNLGFISQERAQQGGWRTDNGYATYTDVSGPQLSAALRAAKALSFDPKSVATYDVPPPIAMPPALGLAQKLMTCVLGLLVFFATLRYLAELRPYSATLSTIGLPRWHVTAMVATMITLTMVVPLVLGHFVAVWINQIGWHRAIHDNYGAIVPWPDVWQSLILSLGIAAIAVLLATFNPMRRLRKSVS